MKTNIHFLPVLAAILMAVVSCFNPPQFSSTPEIKFNHIDKYTVSDAFSGPKAKKDSVIVTIDYTDGDGDLGESVDGRKDKKYATWGNYEIKTFKLVAGGRFEEVDRPDNKVLFFSDLKLDRKKGPIQGKLDFSQFFYHSNSSKKTVIKFSVRIRDRALNLSNVIETDTISVQMN